MSFSIMIKEKIVNKRLDSSVLIEPQNDVISVDSCHVILSAISVKAPAFLLTFIFCPNIKFSAYFLQKSLKQLSTFNFQLSTKLINSTKSNYFLSQHANFVTKLNFI